MVLIVDDKTLQQKIGFKPHDSQGEVIEAFKTKRDVLVCAGRRWGKSMLASYLCLKTALADNQEIAIISASYSLTQRMFEYLDKWVRNSFPSATIQTKPYPQILFPSWNSSIVGLSTEAPEAILGHGFSLVVIDEASRVPKNVFESYILPTLTTKKGKLLMISTPLGKSSWFFNKYQELKQSIDGKVFVFPSSANPYFSDDELQRTKRIIPKAIFDQEFLAVFTDSVATVFKSDDIRACVGQPLKEPEKQHRYFAGLDLAKISDFTVLTIIDADTHEVVHWDRSQSIPYPLQVEKIVAATNKYNRALITIDIGNIGIAIADSLRSAGCRVEEFASVGSVSPDWTKRGSKERLVEKLSVEIQEHDIVIPPNEVLIGELESFGIEITEKGNVSYGAPTSQHDDSVISLALACWNIKDRIKTLRDKIFGEISAEEAKINRGTYPQRRWQQYE